MVSPQVRARRFQRVAGGFQLGDLLIQRRDAFQRQAARSGVVVAGVQGQELGDLLQGEAGGLGRADEAQAAHVRFAVAPHAATKAAAVGARRLIQQPAPLVVADGLHPHPAGLGQARDRRRLHDLTPYHGTEPI